MVIGKRWLKLLLLAVGGVLLVKVISITFHIPKSLLLRQSWSFPHSFHSNNGSFFQSLDGNGVAADSSKHNYVTSLHDVPDVSSKSRDVKSKLSSIQASVPELPACPTTPPKLEGFKMVQDVDKPMKTLIEEWGGVLREKGHYTPPDCIPKDRTAIVIPCRNRWTHLRILLNHLIPVLIRQQLDFTLFVIESDQASHFNKGILLNAAYLEALKYDNYTCFVFQDVDLLPLNDRNLYRCGPQPRHLAVAIDKFKFRLIYPTFFGGVLALSREQVEKVNGHSNVYFGWGGEDDDIQFRVRAKGYTIFRMPVNMSQYHMIRHPRDEGNEETKQKLTLVKKGEVVKRMEEEGLRQAMYQKDWVQHTPLFTWIHVTINETQVIQNLPPYVRVMYKNGPTIFKNHA